MIYLDAITPETPLFICGKVEAVLPTLPAGAFNLEWIDSPYHKVLADEWDRRHRTAADFLTWLGSQADEWRRLLAPNGSTYCWASPAMAACVDLGRRVVAIDESEEWIRSASARADRHLEAKTGKLRRLEMAPIRGSLFP